MKILNGREMDSHPKRNKNKRKFVCNFYSLSFLPRYVYGECGGVRKIVVDFSPLLMTKPTNCLLFVMN